MINRDNYLLVLHYLKYKSETLQQDAKTVQLARTHLVHLLQWLDTQPIEKAPAVRPTMPEHMATARRDGGIARLSPDYMKRSLNVARDFFIYARKKNPQLSRVLDDSWLDTLRMKREYSTQSRLATREYWEIEDVRLILSYFPKGGETLRIKRDKAAVAFLYLSGMRGTAFVTLPVKAVDIENQTIKQLPELGVKTKNSKAAITFLLPIPDLLKVVNEWHNIVVKNGSETPWYAKLAPAGEGLIPETVGSFAPTGRRTALWQGIKELCNLAGVSFKSPHKLRHGHGVYGIKHAKDMKQLKALSQNMMHANIGITDGIYGNLKGDEVKNILSGFTE